MGRLVGYLAGLVALARLAVDARDVWRDWSRGEDRALQDVTVNPPGPGQTAAPAPPAPPGPPQT